MKQAEIPHQAGERRRSRKRRSWRLWPARFRARKCTSRARGFRGQTVRLGHRSSDSRGIVRVLGVVIRQETCGARAPAAETGSHEVLVKLSGKAEATVTVVVEPRRRDIGGCTWRNREAPAHDIEAERRCWPLLIDPGRHPEGRHLPQAGDFFDEANAAIYGACADLYRRGEPITTR
jgi:hypothetical protein